MTFAELQRTPEWQAIHATDNPFTFTIKHGGGTTKTHTYHLPNRTSYALDSMIEDFDSYFHAFSVADESGTIIYDKPYCIGCLDEGCELCITS
jgi:hypothetical protein